MAEAKVIPAQAAAIQARSGSLLVAAAASWQNAGAGGTCGRADHRPGPPGGCRFSVDHDIYQCGSGQAAGGYYQAPGSRDSPHPRMCACAASRCGCSGHPSAQWMRSACILCSNFGSGCSAGFTIADDATLVRLQQETLSTVLEQAYTDPDFCAFADLYDRGRTDNTTGRAVQELYHFTQALPHPVQVLQRFVEMWQSDAPPEKTQWGHAVLRETSARIKGVLRLFAHGAKNCSEGPGGG